VRWSGQARVALSASTLKTVRICFLLLMAVLLPIRGAVAASMLCEVGGFGVQSELRMVERGGSPQQLAGDPHEAAHDHGSAGQHDGHDHGGGNKCNMCSAFCSLTPLVSEAPRLPEPVALPSVKFPNFSTPAPSFLSDGQERPPRTI
jgi:hypothetical protein